jgi:hypothetical protein
MRVGRRVTGGRTRRLSPLSFLVGFALLVGCGGSDDETRSIADPTGATGPSKQVESDPKPPEPRPADAIATVERFYRLLDSYSYGAAWPLVPESVQAESGGFAAWRQGYAANVSSTPTDLGVESVSGKTAVVGLDLHAVDVDACTGNEVKQVFSGSWTLRYSGGEWAAQDIDIEKVGGGTPMLTATECAPEPAPEPTPAPDTEPPASDACTPGYSPCLPPASDYDCEGGSGDGPEYTGLVQVSGSDPYGLDANGDGVGCET